MATPAWFDYETYMNNKLAQLQENEPDAGWTMGKLQQTFADSGFNGAEGAYNHFVTYGADEEVSPNAYFNAEEYYYFKTIEYYKLAEGSVPSEFQINVVKELIEAAELNAWTHYVAYGASEGVNPSVKFDAEAYCAAKAAVMNENGNLNDGEAWTAESIATAINNAGYTALGHYLEFAGTNSTEEVAAGSTYTVEGGTAVFGQEYTLQAGKEELTGTQYDDTFYAGLDTNGDRTLNSTDVIDGAEGSDILVLNDGISLLGTFSNMERLVINESANSSYSAEDFSESVTLQNIDKGTAVEIKDLTSQSLTVTGATTALDVTASYEAVSGAKVATISNESTDANVTFTIKGGRLTTVNFQNNDSDEDAAATLALNKSDLGSLKTVNISGDSNVTVADEAGGDGDNFTSSLNINASELSGKLTMNISNAATNSDISITTGDGGSYLQLAVDTTVTGGAGKDEYVVSNTNAISVNDNTVSNCVTINDFGDGDSITIAGATGVTEVTNLIFKTDIETTLSGLSAAKSLQVFNHEGDTYLVYNAAARGFSNEAGDILIRLAGVTLDAAAFDAQEGVITLN